MIYLDLGGQGPGLVPPEQALIPATDRGFLYGDGLFETALVTGGRIPLLPLHLERLTASAAALRIPCRPEQVAAAARQVAEAHDPMGQYALRITLSRGTPAAPGARGFAPPAESRPTLLITCTPYRRSDAPLTAITATHRVDQDSPLTRHKSLSAMEKVLARAEAVRAGADEALLLNRADRVAEATSANLFLRLDGRWVTPPVTEGCLPGVMRHRLIALTGARERPLNPDDLLRADGVLLTNALVGWQELTALDGHPLRRCQPPCGPADLFAE